ncbi:MAG: thioredoxin domain-containing protein [Promethearchaeota archaeon]
MNKLKDEKSPYLLQHADNPVNWYPWSEEAFEKARKEDKPIFLSIGYSTCHWCHVMAHESFENEEIAALINDVFIPIKVDREERPDIDNIYMKVCQMMTGRGGWPLTIFLTPDKKPFFAATYIPKEGRFGMIGLKELILRIKQLWNNQKNKIKLSADEFSFALQNFTEEAPGQKLDSKVLENLYHDLKESFDYKKGGFGRAPKFPTPQNLLFLLRYWKRSKQHYALEMVEKTLIAMRNGGIYDHIGYGFHRYSTDSDWLVPHFEKMLYDQALIAYTYLEAFEATKNIYYANIAREIFTYVLRDMKSSNVGFYSAENADSEGEEGKFYIWDLKELKEILSEKEYNIAKIVYNVKEEGNFHEESSGRKSSRNILYLSKSLQELSAELNIEINILKENLKKIRIKLFNAREKRIHPSKDNKILTDWNGLMIAALAKGYSVLGEKAYLDAAEKGINFILINLRDKKSGTLYHRYKDGEAKFSGFLNDYAFLIWGLIELYEASFKQKYIDIACELMDYIIEHFWDNEIGGFFFTPDNGEHIIIRQKEIYDGAIPSGNSISFWNLLRLGELMGNTEYLEKAEILSIVFADKIREYPAAYVYFIIGLDFALGPIIDITLRGELMQELISNALKIIQGYYLPNKIIKYEESKEETSLTICTDRTCSIPITDLEQFENILKTL